MQSIKLIFLVNFFYGNFVPWPWRSGNWRWKKNVARKKHRQSDTHTHTGNAKTRPSTVAVFMRLAHRIISFRFTLFFIWISVCFFTLSPLRGNFIIFVCIFANWHRDRIDWKKSKSELPLKWNRFVYVTETEKPHGKSSIERTNNQTIDEKKNR